MFIAIENGQFINENQIFQITFNQSPNGAMVLAFTADGENPRRGDVIDRGEYDLCKAMVKRPGWVKLADGCTYTNLNRCAYVVFAYVPGVGDTARIFIAGRQMHFAKDQEAVKRIRAALRAGRPETPEAVTALPQPKFGDVAPHNHTPPSPHPSRIDDCLDTPPPT